MLSRVKMSFTLSAINEERLYVLSRFFPNRKNMSAIVDEALTRYFMEDDVYMELGLAYETWKKVDKNGRK
jgi:hypothetical protein